ncbi:MAG: Flp pilus assembly protein CpaB [Motilibacteraceae bacterium]
MSRRVLAVALAVVLALVGTGAVLAYVRGADERAVAGQQPVEVYIARQTIPAGTTLQQAVSDHLMVQETVARVGVPDGALTSVDSSSEALVATSDISPGTLIMSARFGTEAAADGEVAIPAGQMAVSVELEDPARVGSFLQVGSQIAIFDTFNVQEADKADTTPAGDHLQDQHAYTRATRLLLPKVKVVGVGQSTTKTVSKTESDSQSRTGLVANTTQTQVSTSLVTVAVTQDQAEKLIHGIQTGTLYFALLNGGSKVQSGPGVKDRDLFAQGVAP